MKLELIGGPFDGKFVELEPHFTELKVCVPERDCLPGMTGSDVTHSEFGQRIVVYERAQWLISHGEWETADGHKLVQRVTRDALRYVREK